jgi:hypothetical protein
VIAPAPHRFKEETNMDDMTLTRPNTPSIDLTAALDPSSLAWWIEFEYSEHAAAISALLTRFQAFANVTANGIQDDFIAGHAADFARDLKQASAALDETRTRIKKPILHAQRLVDGEAKKITDQVTAAVREVETRVTAYLRMKEAEARAAAEAEAQRLAALAYDAMRASDMNGAEEVAIEALQAAKEAETLANAKALELTRTRGVGGALTALKDNWTYEIVALHAVPQHLLQVNDAAVRLAIKQGTREIPGLRIFNDTKVMIR